jgi:hypothetical protein
MRLLSSTLVLAALSLLDSAVTAHNILLKAHSRECFHEELHKGDKMTVSFQTGDREFGGSGNLDINFWVSPRTVRETNREELRSSC